MTYVLLSLVPVVDSSRVRVLPLRFRSHDLRSEVACRLHEQLDVWEREDGIL